MLAHSPRSIIYYLGGQRCVNRLEHRARARKTIWRVECSLLPRRPCRFGGARRPRAWCRRRPAALAAPRRAALVTSRALRDVCWHVSACHRRQDAWLPRLRPRASGRARQARRRSARVFELVYSNPLTFDGADSPILLPDYGFMPIVTSFPYLGDIITRHGGDNGAVDARIVSGSKAFGALRGCLLASNSVTRAARRVVYEAVVLSITLYGAASRGV
mmetsp:Transcript_16326/g.53442  ORF Transcript_16326/g.53442 Transcript_16326/m.53442 type:complete len:217 (+) Transcript_16326:71-721(+)